MTDKGATATPKFSVIIPAYNAEKFIHIAIQSVQEQTINEWELIIVENGLVSQQVHGLFFWMRTINF